MRNGRKADIATWITLCLKEKSMQVNFRNWVPVLGLGFDPKKQEIVVWYYDAMTKLPEVVDGKLSPFELIKQVSFEEYFKRPLEEMSWEFLGTLLDVCHDYSFKYE